MEDTSMINSVGDVDIRCVFYLKGAFPKIIIIIDDYHSTSLSSNLRHR